MSNYKTKGSKTGNIKKNNIKASLFKTFILSSGVVLISTSLIYTGINIKTNRDKDDMINEAVVSIEPNLEYSDSIERMLDEDIDDRYESQINELSSYLDKINSYAGNPDIVQKYGSANDLLSSYKEVGDLSLNLLKSKVADDNNAAVNDVAIVVARDGCYAKIKDGEKINLHGDDLRAAESIANFQGYNVDGIKKDGNNADRYVNDMKKVIIDSIKMVDANEDYKLPRFMNNIR